MLAQFSPFLRASWHSFGGAVCAGAAMLMAFCAQAQNLFEADSGTGNIYEFTPGGTKSTFASGLGFIAGMAFNSEGALFVANAFNGTITEITPGGAQSTFISGVSSHPPLPMAFNGAGDLFLGGITEITPGGAKSTFASGLSGPFGLAFNSAGDLFASCGSSGNLSTSGKIFEFTPNGAQSTFASGLTDPYGLAFNTAGDLFVGNYTSGVINKITPNGVQSIFASGLPDAPVNMVCDSAGDLFVATAGNGEGSAAIYKFTPDGAMRTFVASGLYAPVGLAFQPVPESSALGLLAVGMFGITLLRRRQHAN